MTATRLPESEALLIFPRLRIQNANALSSPLTHGFPAMSAFVGLMWALERKLAGAFELVFDSVGVVCHHHQEQTTDTAFPRTFRLTRNPVDKNGQTLAIVEEGRIHLEVTLLFGVSGRLLDESEKVREAFLREVAALVEGMRVAGGSVLPGSAAEQATTPQLAIIPADPAAQAPWFRRLRRRLLPGYALVSREDLLAARLADLREQRPKASLLDALLDLSRFNWQAGRDESGKLTWRHDHPEGSGWIVPIPVGYGALSAVYSPGDVANTRDPHTPFRFVESLYGVGEWRSPHRLDDFRALLWYGDADPASGLYRVRNDYAPAPTPASTAHPSSSTPSQN
ncbi:MAG: type I-F CRISPR-associated protein Csy2 [Giesbergeria sp.]|jgi:CRISPR-associated protein Csy2|nr:type I-F CRISPR-associated protein Csy2 [Giesbergeria sp.]